MKKDLIAAATWFSVRAGYMNKAYNLESRVDGGYPALFTDMEQYPRRIVDALEVAEGVAMTRPKQLKGGIYHEIGDDYGRFIKANERLPNKEEAWDLIIPVFMNAYSNEGLLTSQQADILRRKLNDLKEEDDGE